MPETPTKLCKDCRWAVNLSTRQDPNTPAMYYECRHPSAVVPPVVSLVTGETGRALWLSCSEARSLPWSLDTREPLCGPDGNFWEPIVVGFGAPEGESPIMITLGLDSADDLAEAIYTTEQAAAALAAGQTPRANFWHDLTPETRAVKISAAERLITLYRIAEIET